MANPRKHGQRTSAVTLPVETVQRRIYVIRGQKVMLDTDLAELYEVETRALVQAVKRNFDRFPEDFVFQLDGDEVASLTSQTVMSNEEAPAQEQHLSSRFGTSSGRGGRRTRPYAFTEQGVAMLSSVLRGPRAVAVNVAIMRAFVQMRETLAGNAELARRVDEIERRMAETNSQRDVEIASIIDVIRHLMAPPHVKRRPVGFAPPEAEDD